MKTRLTSVISLLMATVLVLGVLFASCAPKEKGSQVAEYLNKILEATFAGLEDTEPQVTTSKLTFNNTADLAIPHFVNANMTLMTGTSGEAVSSAEITLDSGKFDFSVYNAGLTCVVGSNVLGPTKYGFEITDIGTLVNLFSSFFMPTEPEASPVMDNGTAQEGSSVSGLLGSLAGINSLLDGNNPEKVYSLLEKYAKIIADAAEGACNSSIKTGDSVKVAVEFNTDSAKKFIKDVFSSLKKDKDLKSIVESVLVTSGMTKEEAKAQIDAIFSDEMARTLYDALDASPFTFKAEVKADKNYILNGISIEYKAEGSTTKVFFNAEEEGKTEIGFSTSLTVDGAFHRQESKIVFENKTVDGADVFEVSNVTIVDNSAHAEPIFKTSVKDGKYSVTIRVPDDVEGPYDMTIAGDIATEGNKTTLTLTSATAFGNTLALDVTVETTVGGTLPTFPTDFKNILDVTGDEFNEILENLENSPLGQFMPKDDSEVVLPDVEY